MKNSTPHVRKEFWDTQKRFLKIGPSGNIFYTEEGKVEYRALFSKHGFALENVRTLEEFRRVMNTITAIELSESNAEMHKLLADPKVSDEERRILAKILKIPVPPRPTPVLPSSAEVIQFADWKTKK